MEHSRTPEAIRFAARESLVRLKAKAYPDLILRKAKGEGIDEKNIHTHRNDIFRLAATSGEASWFKLPAGIQTDSGRPGKTIGNSFPDKAFFQSVGLSTSKPEEGVERLCSVFYIELRVIKYAFCGDCQQNECVSGGNPPPVRNKRILVNSEQENGRSC